jgi:hypothetical protein
VRRHQKEKVDVATVSRVHITELLFYGWKDNIHLKDNNLSRSLNISEL